MHLKISTLVFPVLVEDRKSATDSATDSATFVFSKINTMKSFGFVCLILVCFLATASLARESRSNNVVCVDVKRLSKILKSVENPRRHHRHHANTLEANALFTVQVKSLSGKTISFDVESSETIGKFVHHKI